LTNVLSMVDITERKSLNYVYFESKYILSRFDSIGMVYTHSIVITNNVFYNTYRTALVLTGKYHLLINNLVSTIYWSGTAKPALASYNFNCDGAITSHNALQITMTVGLCCSKELNFDFDFEE